MKEDKIWRVSSTIIILFKQTRIHYYNYDDQFNMEQFNTNQYLEVIPLVY